MRPFWLVHCILPLVASDELSDALAQLTGASVTTAAPGATSSQDLLSALLGSASNPLSSSVLTSGSSDLGDLSSLLDLSSLSNLTNTLSQGTNLLSAAGLDTSALTDQLDAATNTLNSLNALSQLTGTSASSLTGTNLDLNSLADGASSLTGLTDQLETLNSLTEQLQSLTNNALGTTTGSSSSDSGIDLTSLGAANILTGTDSSTGEDNHNNAVLSGLVNAFIQNGYLNQAGQTAIKMSGFAQEAYEYPDLVSALSGLSPCVNSNGELTSSVRSALSQMGIDATYPEDLVAYAMSKGFGVNRRRRLAAETANLKESITKFNEAVNHAITIQHGQQKSSRRLEAVSGYGYPPVGYNPYMGNAMPNMGSMGGTPNMGSMGGMPNMANMYPGAMPYYGLGYGGMPYNPYMMNPLAWMNAYNQQFRGMDQKLPSEGEQPMVPPPPVEPAKKLQGAKGGPTIVPIPSSQYPELAGLAEKEIVQKMTTGLGQPDLIASPQGRFMDKTDMMGGMKPNMMPEHHEEKPGILEGLMDKLGMGGKHNLLDAMNIGHRRPPVEANILTARHGMEGNMMGGRPGMEGNMMGGRPGMEGNMMGGRPGMQGNMMGGRPGMESNMMGGRPGMERGMLGSGVKMEGGMTGGRPGMDSGMTGTRPGGMGGLGSMDGGMSGSRPGMEPQGDGRKSTAFHGVDVPQMLGKMTGGMDRHSEGHDSDMDMMLGEQFGERRYGPPPGHMASPYGPASRGPMMGGSPGGYGPPMMGGSPGGYGPPMMGGSPGGYGPPMMGGSPGGYGPPMMGGSPGGYGRYMDGRHRQLSNWLDDAFNKVVSGVQGSSGSEWKDDVQNAADELANQLKDIAGQLQSGDLPDKLEEWYQTAASKAKEAIDEAGRHRRLQMGGYPLGMPLLNSLATPLVGGLSSFANPLMSNLGLGSTGLGSTGQLPLQFGTQDALASQLNLLNGGGLGGTSNAFGMGGTNGLLGPTGGINMPSLTSALNSIGLRRRLSEEDSDALAKKIAELSQAAQGSGKSLQGADSDADQDNTATNITATSADALQSLGLGDLSSLLGGLNDSSAQGVDMNSLLAGLTAASTAIPSASTTVAPLTVPQASAVAGLDLSNLNLGSLDLSSLGLASGSTVAPTAAPASGAASSNDLNALLNSLGSGADLSSLLSGTGTDVNSLLSGASNTANSAASAVSNSALSSLTGTTSTGSSSSGSASSSGSDLLGLGDTNNALNQAMDAMDLNQIASSLGSSSLDLSGMLGSLSASPVDLNELMNGLVNVDLNKMVQEASNSNVDLNAAASELSDLNLNNLLSGLGDSGIDLNSLAKGILSGEGLDSNSLLKSGTGTSGLSSLLSNPDFSKMLNFLNDIPTLAPTSAGTVLNSQSQTRVLQSINDLLQHQTRRRLLAHQPAVKAHKTRSLLDFYNTGARRLTALGLEPEYPQFTAADDLTPNEPALDTQPDESEVTPSPVDVDYDQLIDFSADGTRYVAATGDLGFRWAFDDLTSLVAPMMACWQVNDMSVSEDDWPSFVVQSVTLELLDETGEANATKVDLMYPDAENMFRYYNKDWNKAQASQRRHNAGCTWVPMCGLHDVLNKMQSRGPVTARLTLSAEKVPPTKDLQIPQARVVVRAVAEQGKWQPVEQTTAPPSNDSRESEDFLLPPTAEIKQQFSNTPVFASELPRPSTASGAGSVGGFAVSGYAVVASAESEGLVFKFDHEDWELIPERARAAYGRILDQLKLFDDSDIPEAGTNPVPNKYNPTEEEDAEYEASAIAMFNAKRDLPVTVPEFTFLPRIVLEATSLFPASSNRLVLQRCLPMSGSNSASPFGNIYGTTTDPLSATVLELLYASAGASQTSIRMKSYLEAAPIQALVTSQEGFSTFDLRDTLINDYRNGQWTVNVTLSPLDPVAFLTG